MNSREDLFTPVSGSVIDQLVIEPSSELLVRKSLYGKNPYWVQKELRASIARIGKYANMEGFEH
jgi:hypothetical protein